MKFDNENDNNNNESNVNETNNTEDKNKDSVADSQPTNTEDKSENPTQDTTTPTENEENQSIEQSADAKDQEKLKTEDKESQNSQTTNESTDNFANLQNDNSIPYPNDMNSEFNQDFSLDNLFNNDTSGNKGGMDQDSINDLFSNEHVVTSHSLENGISIILNSSKIYYERLPMLDVVFDRFVRTFSTSLRNFTSDNAEVVYTGIKSMRFGDYLNSIPVPAMLGVVRANEWENQGLLVADGPLIYSIVDVLLGGRKSPNSSMRIDSRHYTIIERNLIQRMMLLVLKDISSSFEPICDVNFTFERLEINPNFALIARERNAVIVINFRIGMDERGGILELILPYATIEPIRELLLQNFMGEKFGRDKIWENHLVEKLWETDITIEATLPKETLTLNKVMQWKVGTHLALHSDKNSLISLTCNQHPLFFGYIGKQNDNFAIKIEQALFKNHEEKEDQQ